MKLRAWFVPALVAAAAAVASAACGPSLPNDSDRDGISNDDEGRDAAVDTDRDGTPDYKDKDSDGDGVPDEHEAGDRDVDTPPVDSDDDGAPDFRDTDSDENGRDDGVDGVEDGDGDGRPDFADLDDDEDALRDLEELGPDPAMPRDTDGDGAPDFRDTDSDADTIADLYESSNDYDQDGLPNYRDLDSDGDCLGDAVEARGEPPADSDGDTRADFLDRDSDNDGLPDAGEDPNCNGTVEPGETDPAAQDSDGDGVSDLVEEAAGTDPLDPNDNPQAHGDFVFVVPYMKPQTPVDQNLDFSTKLQAVDLYVLLDRSGSMSTEVENVKANLASVVAGLKCPPGVTTDCIRDLWAGAGTIGYTSAGAEAYQSWVDLQPNPSFAVVPTSEPAGATSTEPTTFAAFATVTGQGGASYNLASVPARGSCAGSPAVNAGYAAFGYPCFRQHALPVVLLATDEGPLSGETYQTPNWTSVVAPAFRNRKAKLVGVLGDALDGSARANLEMMANDTGSVDAAHGNAPLVFSGAGASAAAAIRTGILTLANGLPLDINAVNADVPGDAVDAVAAFVHHIETLQLGTPQCAGSLTDIDTNADSYDDKFLQVRTGTPVCWKVVSKPNTTVPAADIPQLFRSTITVYGDGITQLDQRDVYFLVPPRPVDGPIQ
jgi:hypothetical protein